MSTTFTTMEAVADLAGVPPSYRQQGRKPECVLNSETRSDDTAIIYILYLSTGYNGVRRSCVKVQCTGQTNYSSGGSNRERATSLYSEENPLVNALSISVNALTGDVRV